VKQLFEESAKAKAKETVVHLESESSVEVVIAIESAASPYREADHLWGAFVALFSITGLIFLPQEFNEDYWPVAMALSYGAGMFLGALVAPLKRLFIRKQAMQNAVELRAKARFVDGKLARTRGRTALLVHVSAFERSVAFVPDLGLDLTRLKSALDQAKVAMEATLHSSDPIRIFADLKALGPTLSKHYPRDPDDVNELPDEVQ
jgi:putative membrane protein